MKEYIRSFIIGTSLLVVLQFYLSVRHISDTVKNYSYKNYTIIAPLYFGIMNALSLYVGKKYGWSLRERLFYTSIFSGLFVPLFTYATKSYNFKNISEWVTYAIKVFIRHFITYNLIIYSIENHF